MEALYAFEDVHGRWFGPHDELAEGTYETGALNFRPATPVNRFANTVLRVRVGECLAKDVSAHAASIQFGDGSVRRVRLTEETLDLLFDPSGRSPLHGAVTSAYYAIYRNPAVPEALWPLAEKAAEMMRDTYTEDEFLVAVRDLLAASAKTPEMEAAIRTALHRVQRTLNGYAAWGRAA